MARDFSGCVAVSKKALQLHPHCWLVHRALGRAFTALGEYREARRHYRHAMLLHNTPQIGLLAEVAWLDAATGASGRASKLLDRLQTPTGRGRLSLVSVAQVHVALGNNDRALDCLEQACVNRDCALSGLKQDYRFDPLRTASRYRRILAQVGI